MRTITFRNGKDKAAFICAVALGTISASLLLFAFIGRPMIDRAFLK